MIPLAGSAYTYSYATMGELVAWIIGWDLVLEYAMGAATVAIALERISSNRVAGLVLALRGYLISGVTLLSRQCGDDRERAGNHQHSRRLFYPACCFSGLCSLREGT